MLARSLPNLAGEGEKTVFRKWHSMVAVYIASQRCTESLVHRLPFVFPPFFPFFPRSDVSQQSLLHLNIGQVDSHWFPQNRSNGSLCRVRNRKITKEKKILRVLCLQLHQTSLPKCMDHFFVRRKSLAQIVGRLVNLHIADLTSICYSTEDL